MSREFVLLVLCVLGISSKAYAKDETVWPLRHMLEAQAAALNTRPIEPSTRRCEERYAKLWRNGTLNIDWYFGYIDTGATEVVPDRLFRKELAKALARPCPGGNLGACGFKKETSFDADIVTLSKALAKGQLRVRLFDSSAHDFNQENTVGIGRLRVSREDQVAKTDKTWGRFLDSLARAKVVIYDGHSRGGAGPSFGPYNLQQMIGGQLFQPGWNRMLMQMRKGRRPDVLMMGSCESQDYYSPELRRQFREMAVASTSELEYFGAGVQLGFTLVDSLVVGRCQDDMNRAFNATKDSAGAGMRLFGFD